jgi:hypothetical protein
MAARLLLPANALNFVCVNDIPMTHEKKLPSVGPLKATILHYILPPGLCPLPPLIYCS